MEKPKTVLEIERLVLFDGVCNLCNGAVNFLIDHDKNNRLIFSSLQSETGQKILEQAGLPTDVFDSILFYDRGAVWDKSGAALKIMRELGGIWRPAAAVGKFVPQKLRDGIYQFIARNRYRQFGKSESCRIPSPDLKSRFLD